MEHLPCHPASLKKGLDIVAVASLFIAQVTVLTRATEKTHSMVLVESILGELFGDWEGSQGQVRGVAELENQLHDLIWEILEPREIYLALSVCGQCYSRLVM